MLRINWRMYQSPHPVVAHSPHDWLGRTFLSFFAIALNAALNSPQFIQMSYKTNVRNDDWIKCSVHETYHFHCEKYDYSFSILLLHLALGPLLPPPKRKNRQLIHIQRSWNSLFESSGTHFSSYSLPFTFYWRHIYGDDKNVRTFQTFWKGGGWVYFTPFCKRKVSHFDLPWQR